MRSTSSAKPELRKRWPKRPRYPAARAQASRTPGKSRSGTSHRPHLHGPYPRPCGIASVDRPTLNRDRQRDAATFAGVVQCHLPVRINGSADRDYPRARLLQRAPIILAHERGRIADFGVDAVSTEAELVRVDQERRSCTRTVPSTRQTISRLWLAGDAGVTPNECVAPSGSGMTDICGTECTIGVA